jgi:hypothetical protein
MYVCVCVCVCVSSHHRGNGTAPYGRPKLRSRLHFGHNQVGGPRSLCGHLVALGEEKKSTLSPPGSLPVTNCRICQHTTKHLWTTRFTVGKTALKPTHQRHEVRHSNGSQFTGPTLSTSPEPVNTRFQYLALS